MPNRGGFSWKRAVGISAAKSSVSRKIGIPLTKSGRQRKVGRMVTGGGCLFQVTAATVLVAAFVGCSGPVGTATAPTPTMTPRPTPTLASVATPSASPYPSPYPSTDRGLFVDSNGRYQMRVDPGWVHAQLVEGIELWFVGPRVDDFTANVNVLTQLVGSMSLDEYGEMSLANAINLVPDFELISQARITGVSGNVFDRIEYTGTANGRSLAFLGVWFVNDGRAFVATLTALPDAYEALKESVEPFLLTLAPASVRPSPSRSAANCVVQFPSRFEDDPTVMIFEILGVTRAECLRIIDADNSRDEFAKAHPEVLLDAAPPEEPRCEGEWGGNQVRVWGGGMAQQVCFTMDYLASQRPSG
jgi:hypothetical protein